MKITDYKKLVDYTLGNKKSELVLKDINILMVQSGEIIKSDLAIQDGYIVGIGEYSGEIEFDGSGKFVSPGFVDSHLHFESTMTNPNELVYHASLSGTTTFIADPHEAANVSGSIGIKYILDSTENSCADVYIMMPSCVPAKDSEDSGFVMNAQDMKQLMYHPRILGLGEVMDCGSVINLKPSMLNKLELFQNMPIDGHALGLKLKNLSAYAMANISSDHECSTYEEAIAIVRNGLFAHIREGSAAKNLEKIVKGIIENNTDTTRFTFCTDDKHIEDIKKDGHISFNIRKAISLGMQPIAAYKIATYNPAQCYSLKDIGMISPGKKANLVILDDLENVKINSVLYNGRFIREDYDYGYTQDIENLPKSIVETVHVDWFEKSMLKVKNSTYGIQLVKNELLTKKVKVSEHTQSKSNKVVVVERHHDTKKYHSSMVFGYGIENGAVASSVSHDSHNIIVVGDNDEDMMIALECIKEMNGGYVLVENGKVYERLPLPIMGLISDLNSDKVNERLHRMIKKAHEMGVEAGIEPFISLSFIALPVIPEVRITTNGLYDVVEDCYLE